MVLELNFDQSLIHIKTMQFFTKHKGFMDEPSGYCSAFGIERWTVQIKRKEINEKRVRE